MPYQPNAHLTWLWQRATQLGLRPRWANGRLEMLCPAHADSNPSLKWVIGDEQHVVGHCYALCPWEAICQGLAFRPDDPNDGTLIEEQLLSDDPYAWALRRGAPERLAESTGVTPDPLYFDPTPGARRTRPPALDYGGPRGREPWVEAAYPYYTPDGELLMEVWRKPPRQAGDRKSFLQVTPGEALNHWHKCAPDWFVLYRLSDLKVAEAQAPVWICEGEKDADHVSELGLLATTNPGGSKQRYWEQSGFLDPLKGRDLYILEDNDPAGQARSAYLCPVLSAVARSVRVVRLVGLPVGGDITDWIIAQREQGFTDPQIKDHLVAIANTSPAWRDGALGPYQIVTGTSQQLLDGDLLPDFPTHVLPPSARAIVERGAYALPCPPGYIAAPIMVVLGTAIGRRSVLSLKPGYNLPAILWICTIGKPGQKKSPGMQLAINALETLQEESDQRFKAQLAQYRTDFAQWERTKEGDRPEPPGHDHWLSTDFTLESLALMAKTSTGLAAVRDELRGWFESWDQYRKGADKQHWMSSWSAATLVVDRKSGDLEDRHFMVKRPHISVYGTIQPEVFAAQVAKLGSADGFLDRLLVLHPTGVENEWNDECVDPELEQAYYHLVKRLRYGYLPEVVTLSKPAHALWREWYNANAYLAKTSRGIRAGHAMKLEGYCGRFALILHCAEYVDVPGATQITLRTMEHAIEVTEFFRAHADSVYRTGEDLGPEPGSLVCSLYNAIWRAANDSSRDDGAVTNKEINRYISHSTPAAGLDRAFEALKAGGYVLHRFGENAGPGRKGNLWLPVPLSPDRYRGVDLDTLKAMVAPSVAASEPQAMVL